MEPEQAESSAAAPAPEPVKQLLDHVVDVAAARGFSLSPAWAQLLLDFGEIVDHAKRLHRRGHKQLE